MKILPVEEIRRADHFTIKNEPVASIDLMERAATACSAWLSEHISQYAAIRIFCGTGNNGGDGLAIARHLAESNFKTEVTILRTSSGSTPDFDLNLNRLKETGRTAIREIISEADFPEIPPDSVVVDALLGTGLSRHAEGLYASLIDHINRAKAFVAAIDVPSGLFVDSSTVAVGGTVVRANVSLSFSPPKLCYMMAENEPFTGEWVLLDIGLDEGFIRQAQSPHAFTLIEDIQALAPSRARFAHKGHFGHALLIAGSKGKAGAAILAGRGCLHSGAGLLTVHLPLKPAEALQASFPEAMASIDTNDSIITELPALNNYHAIAAGPGIGTEWETAAALKLLIQNFRGPLVLDADALNILSENKTWLPFLVPGTILTPHPREFDRLAGSPANDFDRLARAREFAQKYKLFVVLKGGVTAIITPGGECHFNSTGNPGMATAGSGDVLTGILLGLTARGYDALSACMLGVYLHGLAGDLAADNLGMEYMIAGDILAHLPGAFQRITESTRI
jgi:NAD(P)H-hydrate epimerase